MGALRTTLLLGILLTVGVGRAVADSQCMQDAKDQRTECRAACDDDFAIMRDLCRNIDPECAAGCRADLEACRAPIVAALESCVDACRAQLNADRAACPRRGRGRDFCVDRAQVRAFLCRDDCRESLDVHAGLNACRLGFQSCMAGCGLPPEATPVPTEAPQPTEPPPPLPTETPKPAPTLTPSGPR